jgi:hypothetical protein
MRPTNSWVIDASSSMVECIVVDAEESSATETSWMKKADRGREEEERHTAVPLLSMTFTHDMVGLAEGFL